VTVEDPPANPTGPRTGVIVGSWPLGLPSSGTYYRDLARHTESLGYDLLFSGDHLFMYSPNVEALTVLATFAAATETIEIGTAVLLPALREPALAAKQLASIDYLSGGRLIVGIGVGGEIEQEWRAMEVPVTERGRRTDEYLELMAALWSGGQVDFDGEFRSVHGVCGSPGPVRPDGIPIWVGGRSDAALGRASRHDGWCAYACSPRRIRESVARLDEIMGGRPPGYRISMVLFAVVDDDADRARSTATEVLNARYHQDWDRFLDTMCAVGDPDHVAGRVAEFRAAGVDDVILCPQVPAEAIGDQLTRLAGLLDL
jgi:probable F420-dependent oxidoreductase